MKRILSSLFLAVMALLAMAQDAVTIAEQTEQTKSDASLGSKSVVAFVAKNNNLIITSSNHSDQVGTAVKQKDGTWLTEVTCDLSDKSVERNRTFTVLIKNTSLKGSVAKKMMPGKRFFFKATEADHMLNFWWPTTRNTLYAVAGKACVEFQIPANINGLKVKYSDGIGGKIINRTESGLNIIQLEVDCNQLKVFIADIAAKEQAAKTAEDAYHKLKAENDAKIEQPNFDFDAAEKKEKELETAMETAINQIPQLYIILYGDNSNEVELDVDKIKSALVNPKNKLTVGVNDNLHKEIVGTTPLAEKLRNANNAYESRKYTEAITYYQQAMAEKDATEADKLVCQGWIETISQCIQARDAANDALILLKRFKEKGGQVEADKIVELYDVAINNYNTLFNLSRNTYYSSAVEKLTMARNKVPVIMSGTTVSSYLSGGIFVEEPLSSIDIYAVTHHSRKDMSEGAHGEKVGSVDGQGKFKIELPRGQYEGLLFVPVGHKKFKKNVFQPLRGNKHLDINVRFSKD
jgi:hypothetical protein